MNFKFVHNNINVLDLNKSITFYNKALGLKEVRRKETSDFILAYLKNDESNHELELTWLKNRHEKYDLGDNEVHMAFTVDDFTAAHDLHEKMNCICYENKKMGIYFISDPDGYWCEVLPQK